jgi:CRP/FNR family cyclic AMP-dependent transcriptional regulator
MLSPLVFASQFPSLALGLDASQLDALLMALEPEEVAAGETLITQGSPSDALYLVWDGWLEIELAGRTRALSRLGPGEVVGEVSLLDPGPATATVRSDAGCTVLVLRRARLEQLWAEHPAIATRCLAYLSREMAQRLRRTTIQLNRTRAHRMTQARPETA